MKDKYLDYIRLSTWDFAAYTNFLSLFRTMSGGWRKSQWLQYKGFKTDAYFYGIAEQKGQRHGMVQASGPESATLFDAIRTWDPFYCTRIDLQATIKEPVKYAPHAIYTDVKQMPGNRRNTSIILSNTGSTIYFGNRTSDSFARLYQKRLEEENFIRLELELKGSTARMVYENLRLDKMSQAEMYNVLFKRFKKPAYIDKWFSIAEPENAKYERFEHLEAKNNKLKWLMSLESAILSMGNDHVTGQMTKRFLENLLERLIDVP